MAPGGLAARLTFASHAPRASDRLPQLSFGDGTGDTEAWVFDWQDPQPMAEVLEHPYLDVLRLLWRGDVPALAAEIQELAALSEAADINGELGQSLRKLSERFWADRDALTDDDVPTAVILQILEGDASLTDEARYRYIRKLLHNALNNRDAEAGRRVAEELERNAALEDALSAEFDEMLEDQPDAVYVFIRNRLSQLGVDERWIPRLQTAARNSLEVAIQDGDVGTLAGWLELIAHEPQSYQLGGILRESILFASKRAYNDGELGIHLILIAARRVPDIVDALYADEQLIAALEPKVRAALQSATAEALEPLIGAKAEYFLLALIHGVKAADGQLVTAASARHLWSLYESEQSVELPAIYRAPAVIRLLVTEASHQMTEDAIDILFNGIVAGDDRELTLDTAQHLADRDQLFPRLSRALLVDSLTLEKVQSVIIAVSNMKSASPPAVIDTFFSLLDSYQWDPEAQRMMEALARTMAKHQEVQVSYRHLWKLFDSCHELQVEGAARVAATQLLLQYGEEEDATAIANGVARICHNIGWSSNLKSTVNNWWRDYTRQCSLMQLQRLERELEQQRHLETQKQILKTALAMRRWLHNRNPIDFTAAINTAFTIVEHINDAFDTGQVSELDAHTIRREVEEVGAALSSEERHILANNLRNLANRITQMAENRSKPSLIRSDDSIDRQLMHGEAIPHGSIDMMKWVAGYLDGSHPQSDD